MNINHREYPSQVNKPVVVICLDGSQKEYLDTASNSGLTPTLIKLLKMENLSLHIALFLASLTQITFPL